MNNKKIITALSLGAMLMTATGCKKFLDVNQNPNVASNPEVKQLLPSTEVFLASSIGVNLQINGGIWAQYWTQSPVASQYKTIEQYLPASTSYDVPWGLFYNDALSDLKSLEAIGKQKNLKQYVAISKILQAYTYQVLTDAWGDIPFSEALKGAPQDGSVLSPKYDAQSAVYTGILALIDSASALIDPNDPNLPGSDDAIYQGDMKKWQKFANTLKLKACLRMSEVDPGKAMAGIATLNGASFIDFGEDAQVKFTSVPGSQNPLYGEEVALGKTQNLVASKTVVDSMLSNSDWRAFVFFTTVSGNVVGIQQGNYNTQASASSPSKWVGALANDEASALAPVKFLSSYESYFLQAEAAARGWLTGSDQDLFEAGIFASFASYSDAIDELEVVLRDSLPNVPISPSTQFVLTADYAAYAYINGDTITGYLDGDDVTNFNVPPANWGQYPATGTIQEKVKYIITQKWFSMTGNQGFEAWTEQRRTGFPNFFTISTNSLIGQKFPVRFLYPNSEVTRNQKFPGQKLVTDKVWWDAN